MIVSLQVNEVKRHCRNLLPDCLFYKLFHALRLGRLRGGWLLCSWFELQLFRQVKGFKFGGDLYVSCQVGCLKYHKTA